jgi:hypothetical protein
VIAHVAGVPLEELLPSITGAGASSLLVRAWLRLHLRRRREPDFWFLSAFRRP